MTATAISIALCLPHAQAQKYEYDAASAKKIIIENLIGEIIIKGYSGSKISIEASNIEPVSDKASGLKEIYGGKVDNTGIGLSVTESEKVIYISGASKRSEDGSYTFNIPGKISLKIDYKSPFASEDILVDGYAGELEVSILNPGIELKNITGPVTINTINGDISAAFSKLSQNSPSSVTSINGDVEIQVPSDTPANLKFRTFDGEVYTDCDVEFNKDKSSGDLYLIGGNSSSEGRLNGGGVELSLSSINGSIFLRKK